MSLYHIADKLSPIKEKPFKLEKELQVLSEENLGLIFNLEFVKSEFSIDKFRLDTLAFDPESNAFVIIEYKRNKNFSVIDQGYAYLALMLNNKADFILEYNESMKKTMRKADVDWSQSRVLFVSQDFTTYQREAINFKDLPIELWEVTRYANDTVSFDQLEKSGATESIKTISKSEKFSDPVTREIKVYEESDHLSVCTSEIRELYEKIKETILSYDNLSMKVKKKYIAFVDARNVVDIHCMKKSLKLWINLRKDELDDPKGLARDVSEIGHWGNGDYEVQISDDSDMEYLMSLVKQSMVKNRK
jgi:predicted transport protein